MAHEQQTMSFHRLARLLSVDDNSDAILHESAARAVAHLAEAPETRKLIAATGGVLEGLVRLLSESGSRNVLREAVRALAQVAKLDDFRLLIVRIPHALQNLVQLLISNNCNTIQDWALITLGNLAMTSENRQPVLNVPGALTHLVQLLGKREYPTTQMLAAMVLMNLASQMDVYTKATVVKWSGALGGLAHLLSSDGNDLAREYAVKTLWYLTAHDQMKLAVGRLSPALEGLVGLLSTNENETLQRIAAKVLSNLASKDWNKHTVIHCRGALRGLVRSLAGTPSVQAAAAETVATLTAVSENYSMSSIGGLDETGVLNGMLTEFLADLLLILQKDGNPSAQEQAVTALGNLARTSCNKFKITQHPLALSFMIRLLSEEFPVNIQNRAAAAVANLCELDAANLFSLC